MKILVTVILLLSSLIAGAQAKKHPSQGDTLILSTPTLPAIVKYNNDVYQLKRVTQGTKVYSLDFTESVLAALLQQLDLSNGSHYEVEQLKALIREQLKSQINPKP